MITVQWLWNLVAVVIVIFVWSVAWGDTPLFRFAEHTLVGAAAGYFTVVAIQAILISGVSPLYAGRLWLIIPIILGVLMFSRWTKWPWLYRYSIALVVSTGTGLALRSIIEAQFTSQILATILPITTPDPLMNFNNLVLIIATICCTAYFIFTAPQKGAMGRTIGYVTKLARYFLMITFGVGFVSFFTTAYTFLIERVAFVLKFFTGG